MMSESVIEASGTCEVLKKIPVHLDLSRVMTRLYFHRESVVNEEEMRWLIDLVGVLAKPETVYKASQVSEKTADSLQIDDIRFKYPVLQVNLARVNRVFPYVVTCGREFSSLRLPDSRSHLSYSLDVIRDMFLIEVSRYLQVYIAQHNKLDYLWQLEPGYLQAWPVTERKRLFSIIGDVRDLIGVDLLNDCTLTPAYSNCGIFYYADMEFEACQVCPQEPCMGRRAPYCDDLAKKYSHKAGKPCGSRILTTSPSGS